MIKENEITFVIVVYNNSYINYLKVLLQSIKDVYQDKAAVVIYYSEINEETIAEIKKKMFNCIIKKLSGYNLHEGDYNHRASMKSAIWVDVLAEQSQITNAICLDTDMLVVKPVDKLFEKEFDVGFCYKTHADENLRWPLNAGLMLVKNSLQVTNFLKLWKDETIKFLNASPIQRRHLECLWGGDDQASLGMLLGTRNREDYENKILKHNIILQGFPCEIINEARCVPIEEHTHIIHYKGKWRPVLNGEGFSQWRPKEKCLKMYKLWMDTYKRWSE